MTSYETKLGTVKITSGRVLVKGVWGVMGSLNGREVFVGFAGRPELESAFPMVDTGSVEGKVADGFAVKNGRIFRTHEMDSAGSHK